MRTIGAAVLAMAAATAAAAMELTLERRDIEEALAIAHSSIEATVQRFHTQYRFPVAGTPVDFVEIVSPFRRLVLTAETEFRLGGRMFGQREALAALQPDADRVEVYVELTFHPLNTFVTIPEYDVLLVPVGATRGTVLPATLDRVARFGPRLDNTRYPFPYPHGVGGRVPAGSDPLLGGTLIGRFRGSTIDPKGVYQVSVNDGEKELARSPAIDFLRLR